MNRKTKALEFSDSVYNIKITGRHVEITDAMKDYALEKVAKIERFMDRIIDVTVIMDIQKLEHRVEILCLAGNTKITSQASSLDMYASIDKAVAKLEAQIRRYKDKIHDHHSKKKTISAMPVTLVPRPTYADELDLDEEWGTEHDQVFALHEIVKEEKLLLKTLNHAEAVMKMELSRDPFLLFLDEEDGLKLKVIYRRPDGQYGLVCPSQAQHL